jgi:hypothetical protein
MVNDGVTVASDALEGGGFVVRLSRSRDRHEHVVGLRVGNTIVPLMESLEGSPEESWPPSPPLQQVYREKRSAGLEVALAVGMAGGSHWSASLELDPAAGRITFDVACRVRSVPERLGSSYRLAHSRVKAVASSASDPRPSASSAANLPLPDVLFLVDGEPQAWLRAESIAGEAAPIVRIETERLTIECPRHVGPLPATIRWRYSIGRIG